MIFSIVFLNIKATVEGSESRDVCQFHYTTWPDFGVPDNMSALLKFIDIVTDYQPEDTNPTVVHCRFVAKF